MSYEPEKELDALHLPKEYFDAFNENESNIEVSPPEIAVIKSCICGGQVLKVTNYWVEPVISDILGPGASEELKSKTEYYCDSCKLLYHHSIDTAPTTPAPA